MENTVPSSHLVASLADLPPDSLTRVEVDGKALCVANTACGFRAIDDDCTHEDISLSDGELEGVEIECPAHGSRFNLVTGEVTGLPATEPAKVYEVRVEADELFVDL